MMEFMDDDGVEKGAYIKVIGIGGGGGNAINTMVAAARVRCRNVKGAPFRVSVPVVTLTAG